MTKRTVSTAVVFVAALTAAFLIAGCSGDSPFSPVSGPDRENSSNTAMSPEQIQLYGRVASVDVAERMITLAGVDLNIYAASDCEIASVCGSDETPVEFEAIEVDDSVKVCGAEQEDGSLLANKIRIFDCPDCPDYDVAFRSVIAAIDYAGGTFTVTDRPETIAVDENTVIWGRVQPGPSLSSGTGEGGHYQYMHRGPYDTTFQFTDLAVGDVVEVKANILDADNLLAVKIKLANCSSRKCIEFEAVLATIDADNRIVTFDALEWTGNVCPGAILTDSDGQELTLADFSPGETVAVKGFEIEEDNLNICVMAKTE